MASSSHSIKLPADLAEIGKLRAHQLGYPSWGAYIKGLIRYDAMVQGPHPLTLPLASIPLADQDAVDAKLLENTKHGIGERGQFLTRLLEKKKKGA
ncbi:MAG: hypothetical protein JWO94_752 [Verrucomicrobiaceae bacterium]|nr:hypothetical protein [Verrucomicrobiaceae bacterium]